MEGLANVNQTLMRMGDLLEDMDESLTLAKDTAEELAVTPEQLRGMELPDIRRFRAEVNAARKECNEARLLAKRTWQAPWQSIERAFSRELTSLDSLSELYGSEVKRRDFEFKANRRACLEERYRLILEDNGLGVIHDALPLERILDPRWLNRSYPLPKADDELFQKVAQVMDEYQSIRGMSWGAGLDEALTCYFRTLDLGRVMRNDKMKAEELARAEAVREGLSDDGTRRYELTFIADDSQLSELADFMRGAGIEGTFRLVN